MKGLLLRLTFLIFANFQYSLLMHSFDRRSIHNADCAVSLQDNLEEILKRRVLPAVSRIAAWRSIRCGN